MPPAPDSWIVVPRPRPQAARRLLILPHAGGGPSSYRAFARHLPDLEVRIAAPPGREHRAEEPPVRAMASYVRPLLDALLREPALPLVLLGHSLGAVVAYALALELAAAGRPPTHVFLSARGAPTDLPASDPLHALDDVALLATLRERYGGFPAELDEHPDLLALALATVRADLEVLERYAPPGTRLEGPVTLLWGERDRSHTRDDMLRWRDFVREEPEGHAFPGEHFYLFDHVPEVAERIARAARGGDAVTRPHPR